MEYKTDIDDQCYFMWLLKKDDFDIAKQKCWRSRITSTTRLHISFASLIFSSIYIFISITHSDYTCPGGLPWWPCGLMHCFWLIAVSLTTAQVRNLPGICEKAASDFRWGSGFSPGTTVSSTTYNWQKLNMAEKETMIKIHLINLSRRSPGMHESMQTCSKSRP